MNWTKPQRTYTSARTSGLFRGRLGGLLAALAAAALLLALLPPRAAQAQGEDLIGNIPGTAMSRDEFRARAMAQLATISLAAVAYLEFNGEYPEEFYKLRGSPFWVVEIDNMFKARPLQSISFEPGPNDFTVRPPLGLPNSFDLPGQAPSGPLPAPAPAPDQGADGGQPQIQLTGPLGSGGGGRVDPTKIYNQTEGDIFYYTSDGLLQLVLFAPDGSFYEWVDEVPNPNFRDNLRLRARNDDDGSLLAAAQLLYFSDWLLPRYYNLVQFMGSEATEPLQALQRTPASERIEMASKLGLTMRNVFSRQPISIGMQPGDFSGEGGGGEPLALLLADKSLSLRDLTLGPGELRAGSEPAAGQQSGGRQPGKGPDKPNKPRPGHGGGGRQPKR